MSTGLEERLRFETLLAEISSRFVHVPASGVDQEIEELKQRLARENLYLREEVRLLVEHTDIVGQSAVMKHSRS